MARQFTHSPHVVVLGAGYAGVMAANRIAGAPDAPVVTLVNAEAEFVQRIRLHEYAAGGMHPTVSFDGLLRSNIRLVVAEVSRIIPAERRIELVARAAGQHPDLVNNSLEYDYLVYALGSNQLDKTSDSYSVNSLAGAAALRARLGDPLPSAPLVVLGGGHTGVETAAELAESRWAAAAGAHAHHRVRLQTTGLLLPGASEKTRRVAHRDLRQLGVEVVEHCDPAAIPSGSIVIRCTGFANATVAAASGLPVDLAGRLLVDSTLRCAAQPLPPEDGRTPSDKAGFDRIFGAGDGARISAPGYEYVRQSCAAALPQGAHVADNVLRALRREPLLPLDAGFVARCASLGRSRGIIEFVDAADSSRPFRLTGWAGARTKEAICNMTLTWLGQERTAHKRYRWFSGPRTLHAETAASRPNTPTQPVLPPADERYAR
ncbi:NAD(P)/FAD-dependent oxidoreductase [Lysinibacter cavernae]|uniref:NADH dehydrogenase FAD-containing subunit n=1 Tax=Lysinibacter cavernae TaxID=1640652 RepID=A0A7X5TT30_9MICO|nr:FAD-dependent oxidoreductase [Lysinibacter cavernae]NIH52868.1 NADH dehydrogenase FAD-containing subunit [Lysinibacter cavernae]